MALSRIIGLFLDHAFSALLDTIIPAYLGLYFLHHVANGPVYEKIPKMITYRARVYAHTRDGRTAFKNWFAKSEFDYMHRPSLKICVDSRYNHRKSSQFVEKVFQKMGALLKRWSGLSSTVMRIDKDPKNDTTPNEEMEVENNNKLADPSSDFRPSFSQIELVIIQDYQ